jgi:hypothetical protein
LVWSVATRTNHANFVPESQFSGFRFPEVFDQLRHPVGWLLHLARRLLPGFFQQLGNPVNVPFR